MAGVNLKSKTAPQHKARSIPKPWIPESLGAQAAQCLAGESDVGEIAGFAVPGHPAKVSDAT